jgi:hypothetical protein
MQCNLIYGCEESCTVENSSHFGGNTQSTYNVMKTGVDMVQAFSNWRTCGHNKQQPVQASMFSMNDSVCCAHSITREDGHIKLTSFAHALDVSG